MITDRQREVLNYIIDYWREQRRSPLLREIAEGLGYASNIQTGVARVSQIVGRLEALGHIKRVRGHRNIHVLSKR